jgi:hypothetical protein
LARACWLIVFAHMFRCGAGFVFAFFVVVRCCRVCACCGALFFAYLFPLFIVRCGEVVWQF